MEALIFDMDDTLYDQIKPFQEAFEKNFNFKSIPIEQVFVYSRKFSDELFELYRIGKMDIREMQIKRIQKALEKFEIKISPEEALQFQLDYEKLQGKIVLLEDIRETLDYCKSKGITMGIITNGEGKHQRSKLIQLQINKWISEDNIFISSEVGYTKPRVEIFHHAQESMKIDPSQTFYVGDSFENDVIGAKNAGWNTIWINRRNHPKPKDFSKCDYMVEYNKSLFPIIRSILQFKI